MLVIYDTETRTLSYKEKDQISKKDVVPEDHFFLPHMNVQQGDFVITCLGDEYHIGVVAGRAIIYLDCSGYDWLDDLEVSKDIDTYDKKESSSAKLFLAAYIRNYPAGYNYIKRIFQGIVKPDGVYPYYASEKQARIIKGLNFASQFPI